MIAIGKVFELDLVADRVVTHADGAVSIVLLDGSIKITEANGTIRSSPAGSIMSVQPDGRIDWRPAGTFGAYERGVIVGNYVVWHPVAGHAFAAPFAAKLP